MRNGRPSPSGSSAVALSNPKKPAFEKIHGEAIPTTDEQIQNAKWAKLNLKLAGSSTPTSTKNQLITTNFFRVSLIKDVDIHKYRIVLGKLNGSDETNNKPDDTDDSVKIKRDVARELIDSIFTLSPPSAKFWITDYFSHVVSVEQLYGDSIDEEGAA